MRAAVRGRAATGSGGRGKGRPLASYSPAGCSATVGALSASIGSAGTRVPRVYLRTVLPY